MRNIEKRNKEDYFLFIALNVGVNIASCFYKIQIIIVNDLIRETEFTSKFKCRLI